MEGGKTESQMGEGNMWLNGREETGRMTVNGMGKVAIGDPTATL
jgi:hypothetical protein